MRIGFVGLGIMGQPMARNLLKAGHQLSVHNRTRSREDPLVALGAVAAANPAAAASGVQSVHLCLSDQRAVREVVFGGGLLAAMQPGQVLVDHGTSGVALARELDTAARARGVQVLDAPVSGGVEGAEAGTLAIMVGGERSTFARLEPVLHAMGSTVKHAGPAGSGQALKLANQLLVVVQQLAAAEAFAFARAAGVDGQIFAEVLTNAWGRSFMLERSLPNFLAGAHPPGRASWRILRKDALLIAASAREMQQPAPLTDAALRLAAELFERGLGQDDLTECLRLYQAD